MRNLWMLLILLTVGMTASYADNESDGAAAEQAGKLREALTHYVSALQSASEGSSKDQQLREKIITLAKKLTLPPAVPEEAEKYEGRAEYAIKMAKTEADFVDVANEYKKALLVAPWVATYYYNLGVILEKANKPAEAKRNFQWYLLAAPNASDARDVRKRISGLEYATEKAAKEQAARAREDEAKAAYQRNIGFLSGTWRVTFVTHFERLNPPGGRFVSRDWTAVITINGKEVTITDDRNAVLVRGTITGVDAASIRWRSGLGISSGEPVNVNIQGSRITFSLDGEMNGQRLNNFIDYILEK